MAIREDQWHSPWPLCQYAPGSLHFYLTSKRPYRNLFRRALVLTADLHLRPILL